MTQYNVYRKDNGQKVLTCYNYDETQTFLLEEYQDMLKAKGLPPSYGSVKEVTDFFDQYGIETLEESP